MEVPPEGWVVREGGFMVNLTEETTLYGIWGGEEGKTVPAGSLFVYGDYNINVSDNVSPDNESPDNVSPTVTPLPVEPIIIHFQSVEPIVPDLVNNGTTFRCTAIAPWGEGIAQGISYPQTVTNTTTNMTMTQANSRNIQTYPAYAPSAVMP
jgi:hypothetical protein